MQDKPSSYEISQEWTLQIQNLNNKKFRELILEGFTTIQSIGKMETVGKWPVFSPCKEVCVKPSAILGWDEEIWSHLKQ